MSKWIFAAGAAAIALSAPTLADPGGNKGKGGGDRHGQSAKRDGGGHAKSAAVRTEHRGGGALRVAKNDRGRGEDKQRVRDDHRGNNVVRIKGNDRGQLRDRNDDRDYARLSNRDDDRRLARVNYNDDYRRGLSNGCPPGLAKKNNGCLPPGQAKKLVGGLLPAGIRSGMLEGPYSQWYRDDDRYYYRNDGDYIYRVNRQGGLIDALIPFASRDYGYYPVGMNYPVDYNSYNVPYQYRSFYPDGGDYNYRYGNNAIYQVNPQTNAIQSIVALLAGDLSVGQQMPSNYGVYNVPLDYRDRYYDSPDAMYRYNDGYIYRADPKTQLITAVIDAIV
ncbi:MAG: hypothetical protein LH465_05855 [Sphingomonas bacterium]|nr:hypothetical protein [Sphingomonas bacterium]